MNNIPMEDLGIVGAGGAGFPLHRKLQAKATTYILNAAECEPLLHKDKELIQHYARDIINGMTLAMKCVGAEEGVIGIKAKYTEAIKILEAEMPDHFRFCLLGSYYPAGDEFILVYEAVKKVIPPGGLPLDVGCVVSNVETMLNLGRNLPVTTKYLTICGAVHNPCTIEIPIGATFQEAIDAAGGANTENPGILIGGTMMGRLATDTNQPITKTTGGLVVLPENHILMTRYGKTTQQVRRIAKSSCDQCSFCTELCPRYLLGHPIEPHMAMRAEGFSGPNLAMVAGTSYCCECNLCTMIACPEDLDPRAICVLDKTEIRKQEFKFDFGSREIKAHAMFEHRRTPVDRLKKKMGLSNFDDKGPLLTQPVKTKRVQLMLSQHIGAPSIPIVSVGDRVVKDQMVAKVPDKALGAPIHASIAGKVSSITDSAIIIEQ